MRQQDHSLSNKAPSKEASLVIKQARIQTAEGWKRSQLKKNTPKTKRAS